MLKKSGSIIVLYTAAALLIDLAGRYIADRLMLPVWFDSVGTFLIAYAAGPVCGAIVGFANNIIYGIFVDQQSVYCIVGALLGAFAGYFAKKRAFDTQFRTMSLGMGLALMSTFCAVIINTVLYDGMTGNVWGDQMMLLCIDSGFSKYISYVIAQFSVEFLDKLLTAEIIYLMRKAAVFVKGRRARAAKAARKALLGAGLAFAGVMSAAGTAEAAVSVHDYDAYIQTGYAGDEGLLPGEANDIAQTKDGRLWIGTYAGLFKYDGSKFTLMQDAASVKNVNCLYVDEEGRLWVGTNDDGVTVFINDHVINVLDTESGLKSDTVRSIVCDSAGNYYIATPQGLSIVSLSGGIKVTKSFDNIKNVSGMSADADGNVAAVTGKGELYCFNNGELAETVLESDEEAVPNTVLFTDDERLMLAYSDNAVRCYDMRRTVPQLMYEVRPDGIENINSLYKTESGDIFICSDTGAAVIYADGSCSKINTGDFTSSVDHMLVDYQDNLWFCSSRLGLLELSRSPFTELFAGIADKAVVNAAEKVSGLLFVGTDDGLVIIDEENAAVIDNELSRLLDGVRVRDVTADSSGYVWIATSGMGLYRVRQRENGSYAVRQFTDDDGLPGMRFRNVIELSDGRKAAAGDYGTAVLDGENVTEVYTAQNGLANEKSLCLLEYDGALYIGSDGGGIARIRDGHIDKLLGRRDGLSSDIILRMVREPESGGMFIVTSNGLCYMDASGGIRRLSHFPYSNNYDIVCGDDGNCWVLGSAGIYIAGARELIEDRRSEYPLINSKSGFRDSLTANAWLYREGTRLYLCCDSGAVSVDMTDYDSAADSYRMVMDQVTVDGERFDIDRVDSFVMPADADTIVFEPEILNYLPEDPYVSVILEGYDRKESTCLLSELGAISYTGLKPGSYVFRVSIVDGLSGSVSEYGSYRIEKEAKMYQSRWFRLYVALIAGLVTVWVTWFITKNRAQKVLLKQQYELEYARKQIKMGNETILSIARTVDAKDSNTSRHSFRVSEYAVAIARRLGYSEEKCENLRQIALMHDIGKIGIPDAILNKPDRLTDEEYEIMKTHVLKGGEILKDFTMIDNVSLGALYHHERYDGKGYCHGLKGEEIPLDARIIGIADAFDAMTANRVYRRHLSPETVIGELKKGRGTQFDPKLTDIMLSLIDEGVIDFDKIYEYREEQQS